MKLKKVFIYLQIFLFSIVSLFARVDNKNILWDEYLTLRDYVYNSEYKAEKLVPFYKQARKSAEVLFEDDSLYIAYSRCEYIMGRAYSYEKNKEKAGEYYDAGVEYVQKALEMEESGTAYLMYGENVSQNCSVKPVSYAISKGTKVGGFAKKVLEIDPNNGAAHYMKLAQYIYAPTPFHNYGKGIKEMKKLLEQPGLRMEKDDLFNITSAIGYGYMGKKDYDQAIEWLEKSLEYYPNNKYVNTLIEDIKNK